MLFVFLVVLVRLTVASDDWKDMYPKWTSMLMGTLNPTQLLMLYCSFMFILLLTDGENHEETKAELRRKLELKEQELAEEKRNKENLIQQIRQLKRRMEEILIPGKLIYRI